MIRRAFLGCWAHARRLRPASVGPTRGRRPLRYAPAQPPGPDSARRRRSPVATGTVYGRSDGAGHRDDRESARAHQRRVVPTARTSASEQLSALCLTCPARAMQGRPHHRSRPPGANDRRNRRRIRSSSAAVIRASSMRCRDGARVSGETPRGLYRFRITGVSDRVVEIDEIEEIALFEV